MEKTFFIDLSRCTACRGCQVACKQWHKLPAEQTRQTGSHQNPADLSFHTYKLVRFSEVEADGQLKWLFFPEQCRHCVIAPCLEVADGYIEGSVLRDEATGAVLFTERMKQLSDDEKQEVRDACPYDIPRLDPESGLMAKCDFCIDRVHNGLKPACVGICPTGAMNFGDREEMLPLAEARLAELRKTHPGATLMDPDDVNVLYLSEVDPKLYHTHAVAEGPQAPGMDRRRMMARMFPSLARLG
ncbi:4Fe-4S dicluster domain-containing protein [Desulfocurvus vexinensis]|uniref:4Fe-4S dicluster domain-containing protein n=1 Tax=Desulfocurvus vexinensis TaxID=399548 RepID=UPI00048F50CA|nr:4Fe-4S dicluster domain-containing protein [Desulfocurvus vexinensis]